jgi:ABC-type antimicrobial peptide transport system permease subunit
LITYELSFDKIHSKYESLYRVVRDVKTASGEGKESATPYPLTRAFRNDFPDVPLVTQMHFQYEVLLSIGAEKQKLKDILFADSLFFEVFDFKVLSGNPKVALGEPGKVFLTKSLADKILHGNRRASLKINKVELEVAGIIADPPPNSHINFSMVVSMPSFTGDFIGGLSIDEWGMTARGFTYIVLPANIPLESMESRFKKFVDKYGLAESGEQVSLRLQPLSDVHFNTTYTKNPGNGSNVDPTNLIALGILGLFILFIACINFINLATASSEKKSREIGIRKTLGAERSELAKYFLTETFLLTVFSVLLSLCATEWLLRLFNPFLEKQLDLQLFSNPLLGIFLLVLILFTTFCSGFYPALVLSRYNPSAILKNRLTVSASGTSLRKILVVFQFVIAQVLIMGTLIVADQMEYFRSKPLGFEEEAIINVPMPTNKTTSQEALRTTLEANPNIQDLTFSMGAPVSGNDYYTDLYLSEKGREGGAFTVGFKSVDRHYLRTYKIKLLAGRWFNEHDEKLVDGNIPEKDQRCFYVLNESAVKKLGFQAPNEILGKLIATGFGNVSAEVIGVVQDFHIASLHKEIMPVAFTTFPYFYHEAGIKVNSSNLNQTLKFIEKSWLEVYPEYYFEYEFFDEHLASLYKNDEKTYKLFRIFSGVSIFIGCLGLYGLISFVAVQKQKEVGIRKVMGASVSSILLLFSREFVKLIVIAFGLAVPLTWYFMNQWLQAFAYKIDISWSLFFMGFLATLIIVLLTIAYRSIRAARINPAITLREQ